MIAGDKLHFIRLQKNPERPIALDKDGKGKKGKGET
jgi:hypothetical protein